MLHRTNVSQFAQTVKWGCCLVVLLLFACSGVKEGKVQLRLDKTVAVATPVSIDTGLLKGKDIKNLMLRQFGEFYTLQLKNDQLWFVHNPMDTTAYTLEQMDYIIKEGVQNWTASEDGNLRMYYGGHNPVTYRYGMTYPPKGVDSIFGKSGFIHPIIAPNGDTLTRIQPPDHYHHYGLWGPWTHTRIDTTRVDFWNLGEGMGTVLFKEFKDSVSGDIFSSFTAKQEHIDLKTREKPQLALNEELEVKLWNLGRLDRYMFDYSTTISSPLENGILFEAYRYGGGIGMRFTERWHKDNCEVITSEGKNRLDADGTNARWCMVRGESSDEEGTNGILFMSYPENRMHPEPMRIWPIDGNNGRGDMFFEFCPIRHKEWQIEPNKKYRLKYRIVVFEGDLTVEEAEAYWQAFAEPPKVIINEKGPSN